MRQSRLKKAVARAQLPSLALAVLLSCGGRARTPRPVPAPEQLPPRTYAHYLRGQLAFERGDYGQAIDMLKAAKHTAPSQAPIARALAEAYYRGNNRRAAEEELAEARRNWPKNSAVWLASAHLHLRAREFTSAAHAFRKAIALGERDAAAYLSLGEALVATDKRAEAKAIYRRLTGRKTNTEEAHYRLSALLFADRALPKALIHAQEATLQAPYNLDAWALLAAIHTALGNDAQAQQALRTPFDRSQGAPVVGEQLSESLRDLGQRDLALRCAATLDRDDLPVDTRISMGHWLLRAGDAHGAVKVAARLAPLSSARAPIAELQARALRALGKHSEAAQVLLSVAQTEPGYPLMQAMLGELYADTGELSTARALVDSAIAKHPDNPDLTMASATIAEFAGDLTMSRTILRSAIARHPGAQRPLFRLAEVESRAGNASAAIATVAPLLEANPRNFAALNYIGYSLIADETEHERARDLLLRALELSPDSAFVLDSYGWFLFRTGKHRAAARLLERAVRLTPTEPELLAHLAELRWSEGRRDEAHTLLRRARKAALSPHIREAVEAVQKRLGGTLPRQ